MAEWNALLNRCGVNNHTRMEFARVGLASMEDLKRLVSRRRVEEGAPEEESATPAPVPGSVSAGAAIRREGLS